MTTLEHLVYPLVFVCLASIPLAAFVALAFHKRKPPYTVEAFPCEICASPDGVKLRNGGCICNTCRAALEEI